MDTPHIVRKVRKGHRNRHSGDPAEVIFGQDAVSAAARGAHRASMDMQDAVEALDTSAAQRQTIAKLRDEAAYLRSQVAKFRDRCSDIASGREGRDAR